MIGLDDTSEVAEKLQFIGLDFWAKGNLTFNFIEFWWVMAELSLILMMLWILQRNCMENNFVAFVLSFV